MSQKKSDTLGLALLVLVFLAAFLFVNPMFRFSCSRLFMHDFLGMHTSGPESVFLVQHGLTRFLPLTILFFLWAAVSLWVYRDAERRNHSGLLWGLFVFVGNVVGLIIYLILRTSSPEATAPVTAATAKCPSCGGPTQTDYVACPHCGVGLSNSCPGCGKRVEPGWKACPFCGGSLTDNST
jgi:hypothetical protein